MVVPIARYPCYILIIFSVNRPVYFNEELISTSSVLNILVKMFPSKVGSNQVFGLVFEISLTFLTIQTSPK